MTDRPIDMRGFEVRALLDGRKTMDRHLAWRRRESDEWLPGSARRGWRRPFPRAHYWESPSPWQHVQPGDRLWVREAFTVGFDYDEDDKPIGDEPKLFYAATFRGRWYDPDADEWRNHPPWTPSIHMPRWASRLTLIVTATKIERLQAISEADAMAEGVQSLGGMFETFAGGKYESYKPRGAFRGLWMTLHGPKSWDANPEVVAPTFRVVRANIDSAEAT